LFYEIDHYQLLSLSGIVFHRVKVSSSHFFFEGYVVIPSPLKAFEPSPHCQRRYGYYPLSSPGKISRIPQRGFYSPRNVENLLLVAHSISGRHHFPGV